MTLVERLEQYSMPEPNSGCVLWIGATSSDGYAHIRVGRTILNAAKVSFEIHRGTMPSDLVPDHLCRARSCINAWHLDPVTHRVNILRGTSPGAQHAKTTVCSRGHQYDVIRTTGARDYRICRRLRARASEERLGVHVVRARQREASARRVAAALAVIEADL